MKVNGFVRGSKLFSRLTKHKEVTQGTRLVQPTAS